PTAATAARRTGDRRRNPGLCGLRPAHRADAEQRDQHPASGADQRRQPGAARCHPRYLAASGLVRPVGLRRRRPDLRRTQQHLRHGPAARPHALEPLMEILLLEALGVGAVLGLLLGLTGAGGSLVSLPPLLSLHLPLRDAIGVSLGAVAITALIGAIPRVRQGLVAWRPAVMLAIAGLPGNVAGQWLGRQIPEAVLILGFCALVLWTAWRMWRSSNLPRGSG